MLMWNLPGVSVYLFSWFQQEYSTNRLKLVPIEPGCSDERSMTPSAEINKRGFPPSGNHMRGISFTDPFLRCKQRKQTWAMKCHEYPYSQRLSIAYAIVCGSKPFEYLLLFEDIWIQYIWHFCGPVNATAAGAFSNVGAVGQLLFANAGGLINRRHHRNLRPAFQSRVRRP